MMKRKLADPHCMTFDQLFEEMHATVIMVRNGHLFDAKRFQAVWRVLDERLRIESDQPTGPDR